jgi:hypothetical protein
MWLRTLVFGLLAPLLVAARAAAGEAPAPEVVRPMQRLAEREPVQPLFRWGVPDSPFPLMEAERKLLGFHLEFKFGGSEVRRRDRPLR